MLWRNLIDLPCPVFLKTMWGSTSDGIENESRENSRAGKKMKKRRTTPHQLKGSRKKKIKIKTTYTVWFFDSQSRTSGNLSLWIVKCQSSTLPSGHDGWTSLKRARHYKWGEPIGSAVRFIITERPRVPRLLSRHFGAEKGTGYDRLWLLRISFTVCL